MGLDMYLYRKTYVKNWDFMTPEQLTHITITKGPNGDPYPGIDVSKISEIVEQVAYWRKANEIHDWFVQHCQNGVDDCKEYYVTREQLKELVDLCKEVLADKRSAEKKLPTKSGFFFGSTDYDEWYLEDLKSTIEQLTPLLDQPGDYYYQSSW